MGRPTAAEPTSGQLVLATGGGKRGAVQKFDIGKDSVDLSKQDEVDIFSNLFMNSEHGRANVVRENEILRAQIQSQASAAKAPARREGGES